MEAFTEPAGVTLATYLLNASEEEILTDGN
jgi:hypothetical protein